MILRCIKILLVLAISLLCLLYGGQNLVNTGPAFASMATVVAMDGHAVYPGSLAPPITSPVLIWLLLGIVILGELLAGFIAAWGAWLLWCARKAPAADFNAAKGVATLGAGIALIVWFGLFTVFGGALFQMWQTEIGAASLQGAFQYLASVGIVILFVNMEDS